jgi:hypothetical protein
MGAYPKPYIAIIAVINVNVGLIDRNGSGPMNTKTMIMMVWPKSVISVGKGTWSQACKYECFICSHKKCFRLTKQKIYRWLLIFLEI